MLIYMHIVPAIRLQKLIWQCFSITTYMRNKGKAYQDAKAKLQELGLGETIETTGVGRFGDSVRNYLQERLELIMEERADQHVSEVEESFSNDADISPTTEDTVT